MISLWICVPTRAVEAPIATAPGVRNAVVADEGVAYLTDSLEGKLLVVSPHGGDP